jgi:hypothetical protein
VLGLDCTRGLPADGRAVRAVIAAAIDAGVRIIDVGDARQPGIGGLFRDLGRAASGLSLIARLGDLPRRAIPAAVDEVRRSLAVDRLDFCLIRGSSAGVIEAARELAGDGRGHVGAIGVWDPGISFVPRWEAGTGAAISLPSGLLTMDQLNPFLRTAQGRPVFVRWDLRVPPAVAVPPAVRSAMTAAGISLPALGLSIPLYTPCISAILLPAGGPGELPAWMRSASAVNPDSRLMRDFLDSGILKANQC